MRANGYIGASCCALVVPLARVGVNRDLAADARRACATPHLALGQWPNNRGLPMLSPLVATLLQVFVAVIGIVWFLVIAHVIFSWLVNFQVLNLRQPLVAQLWYLLNRLTEPLYKPIRRFLPDMGGLDLAPLVVILILFALRQLIANYYYALI
jgi:YggT family protein